MKNRKRIVIAFLVVAALLLGVGYANLTDFFTATATVEANKTNANAAFDEDLYLSDASYVVSVGDNPNAADSKETVTIESTGDILTINAEEFSMEGDYILVRATINNDNALYKASFAVNTKNTTLSTTHFRLDYAISTDAGLTNIGTGNDISHVVGAQSAAYLYVKVTLLDTPEPTAEDSNPTFTATLTVQLDATAVAVNP